MKTSITSDMPEAITSDEIKQTARFVSDAAGKATETAIEKLHKAGKINKKSLQQVITQVITKGNAFTAAMDEFIQEKIVELGAALKQIPIWLRAKVGGVSREKLITDIDNVPVGDTGLTFQISDYAKDMTSKPECVISATVEEANFAIATPENVGFKVNPRTEEFFDEKNLTKYGLELCKSDDPHSLRKIYTNQPDDEWLPVAMKPIRGSGGYWRVFYLGRDGSLLWLDGDYGAHPQDRGYLGRRVVFRVR